MRGGITIGSRGSRLAVIQAESVASAFRKLDAHLGVQIRTFTTQGDRHRDAQLHQMGGEGVFVRELEDALLGGVIDIAVHSLKDLPTQVPSGLRLAAVMERVDPRDVLISVRGKLSDLPPGSRIGTDSIRRSIQLSNYRPDVEVSAIRGNVDTRIRKVLQGEFDGAILAAAGIIRLGWKEKVTEYLSMEHFLPSAGQGALGIQVRSDDSEVTKLVSLINHEPTWRCVTAERTFLRSMGGGCRAPIAALCTPDGDVLRLRGMVADVRGITILHASEEGRCTEPEEVGTKLAHRMAEMGASTLLETKRCS